jgi:hypothetical protein
MVLLDDTGVILVSACALRNLKLVSKVLARAPPPSWPGRSQGGSRLRRKADTIAVLLWRLLRGVHLQRQHESRNNKDSSQCELTW